MYIMFYRVVTHADLYIGKMVKDSLILPVYNWYTVLNNGAERVGNHPRTRLFFKKNYELKMKKNWGSLYMIVWGAR